MKSNCVYLTDSLAVKECIFTNVNNCNTYLYTIIINIQIWHTSIKTPSLAFPCPILLNGY